MKTKQNCFVIPFDKNLKTDFYIPSEKCLNAKNNDRVVVKILDWPSKAKSPFGEITEVFGKSGDLHSELNSIIKKHNISEPFSQETIKYVDGLSGDLLESDLKDRKDFREHCCFTIDPKDAKDFDDALSVKKIEKNIYEIGIHIADVSHYVRANSAIDKEAFNKGCSVYLADKVIPMLPEKLANKLCSLRPLEEKLCFSVVFNITTEGRILSNWIGKTVIKSKKRFTYEDAQEILNENCGLFIDELNTLNIISNKLRSIRIKNGSIIIEKKEVFVKFENNIPLKACAKEPLPTNRLIEEFMLLANQTICDYYNKFSGGVYRIHDKPDPEKLNLVSEFLKTLGLSSSFKNTNLPKSINKLLVSIKDSKNTQLINQLILNSMAKAEYSTNNIGHFGLGFKNYSHFTSPIRRYPDILVHRILESILKKQKKKIPDLENLCQKSSQKERIAIKAERDYTRFLLIWLVRKKVGEICNATISSIKDWGIYAEIDEYLCEGMISISSLKKAGSFYYNNKKNQMINKRNGEVLSLGDKICVKIEKVNLSRSELDLIIQK